MKGRIELILGPMFAGKTSEMMKEVEVEAIVGKECLVILAKKDTRSGGVVLTHSGKVFNEEVKDNITVVTSDVLGNVDKAVIERSSVIGIDEGWMFDDLDEYVCLWASRGKRIIISSIDSDYNQNTFPSIMPLIGHSEQITKLQAVCNRCKSKKASFSALVKSVRSEMDRGEHHDAHRDAQRDAQHRNDPHDVLRPGGKETYEALCRGCLANRT